MNPKQLHIKNTLKRYGSAFSQGSNSIKLPLVTLYVATSFIWNQHSALEKLDFLLFFISSLIFKGIFAYIIFTLFSTLIFSIGTNSSIFISDLTSKPYTL